MTEGKKKCFIDKQKGLPDNSDIKQMERTMLDKSFMRIFVLMTKLDTGTYPEHKLPEGYSFCMYQDGFANKWAEIQYAAGEFDTLRNPEHQGKGIGKALLTGLMRIYNESGYKDFIYLITQTWSYPAVKLYESFGFKPYYGKKPANWGGTNEEFEERNRNAWDMIEDRISKRSLNCFT